MDDGGHSVGAPQPRVAGLVPAFLVGGLGSELPGAADRLGLEPHQLRPFADDSLQAELPRGRWRYWPSAGVAMWSGERPALLVSPGTRREPLALLPAMERLFEQRLVCAEMRLLSHEGWSGPLDGRVGLTQLARVEALGLSGWWSDDRGLGVRAEIFVDGAVWGESSLVAERLLLTAAGRTVV